MMVARRGLTWIFGVPDMVCVVDFDPNLAIALWIAWTTPSASNRGAIYLFEL
jgi:hypothetical protein